MTATLILDTLAKEFSISPDAVRSVLEMVDAGLSSPFIGRYRRDRTGGLPEIHVRRLVQRREELAELDRRRGTILRALEKEEGIDPRVLESVQTCMDRFELEDLFVPHRRPEPEVQLALDRGLGALADALVKPVPRSERAPGSKDEEETSSDAPSDEAAPTEAPSGDDAGTPPPAAHDVSTDAAPEGGAPSAEAPTEAAPAAEAPAADSPAAEAPSTESSAGDAPAEAAPADAAPESAPAEAPADATADAPADAAGSTEAPASTEASASGEAPAADAAPGSADDPAAHHGGSQPPRIELTAELSRLCAPFVSPDKGVHTEAEALSGAMRILSDRLGRNPHLRGLLRRMLRKRGVLKVRPLVDDKKAGRHKSLLKLEQPLRQIQGHRLLAIRQAQKERALNTLLLLDPAQALPKVRAALGKHTRPEVEPVLHEVARRALEARLLPVVEADVRLELKERGDWEALRFLSQHLRQLLLTPPLGAHPVVGIDVNAKGDWTAALVDRDGQPVRVERIELGEKDEAALGAELAAVVGDEPVRLMAVAGGRSSRNALPKLRAAARAANLEAPVVVTTEAGLGSYANSELARKELGDHGVPQRMAISLARRVQDPMAELLKVHPRHLGLGSEQGLVSKANLNRVLQETVDFCVAHVGCRVNSAPQTVLEHVPGLDAEAVQRLVARRETQPFRSREELRSDDLLTEAQWTSAIAFLRVPESDVRLDGTSLHPEQYALAERVLESVGSSVEEGLGRREVTKGLRRDAFGLDEGTWRELMRELAFPGRDPRPRNHVPELMSPDTDAARITAGRVVEGVVTSVTSFGAFVDLGLAKDGMLHVSELSQRYLRDAREVLSVGQTLRARITDPTGQRVGLSLKDVAPRERRGGRPGGGRREGAGGRREGGRRGEGRERGPKLNLRPGDARGMPLGSGGRGGRRGGPGGKGGDRRRDREPNERVDLARLNAQENAPSNNPFARFFQEKTEGEG